MPNYSGLKAEIAKPAYSGMSDDQIAAALLVPQSVDVDVQVVDVESYLRLNGLMFALSRFYQAPPAGADINAVAVAFELYGLITAPRTSVFQTSDPARKAMLQVQLGLLQAAGILSAENIANLMALTLATKSIAQQLGFPAEADMNQEIAAARIHG